MDVICRPWMFVKEQREHSEKHLLVCCMCEMKSHQEQMCKCFCFSYLNALLMQHLNLQLIRNRLLERSHLHPAGPFSIAVHHGVKRGEEIPQGLHEITLAFVFVEPEGKHTNSRWSGAWAARIISSKSSERQQTALHVFGMQIHDIKLAGAIQTHIKNNVSNSTHTPTCSLAPLN